MQCYITIIFKIVQEALTSNIHQYNDIHERCCFCPFEIEVWRFFSKCTSRRTCWFIIFLIFSFYIVHVDSLFQMNFRCQIIGMLCRICGIFTGLGLHRYYICQVSGMTGCHVFSMYFTFQLCFICLHVIISYPCCLILHVYYRNPNKA